MHSTAIEMINDLLREITDTLDIPDELYQEAVLKYEDVGAWLADEASKLSKYSPEIYPQGAFRLGTMIEPITDGDDYDIDLVCRLEIEKDQITKVGLKAIVGDQLKKRDDIARVLSESRRCWVLDYPGQFHMDVLPSIPNVEGLPTGILLPDKELHEWQKSDPIAYADWFYEQMRTVFDERRIALAKELRAEIEDVPWWQVKTPLQRVVQILKRHRDLHFQNDPENRPASIIITTLCARAYGNQEQISLLSG